MLTALRQRRIVGFDTVGGCRLLEPRRDHISTLRQKSSQRLKGILLEFQVSLLVLIALFGNLQTLTAFRKIFKQKCIG